MGVRRVGKGGGGGGEKRHYWRKRNPRRWIVITSMVGLKNKKSKTVTYVNTSPQNGEPHRYNWGTRKKKKKKWKKNTEKEKEEKEKMEDEAVGKEEKGGRKKKKGGKIKTVGGGERGGRRGGGEAEGRRRRSCLLVGCLTFQQHASVSHGWTSSDNFTCCHTEIEVADQTFYLTQSQYTDTGPTSPSADPITPGA